MNVEIQESVQVILIKIEKYLISKGYSICDRDGFVYKGPAIQVLGYDAACVFGILVNNQKVKKHLFEKPRRIFLGIFKVMRASYYPANTLQSIDFQCYGSNHKRLVKKISEDIMKEFSINVNPIIVNNDQKLERFVWD